MKPTLPLALGIALALTLSGCSKTDTAEVAETAPEIPTETAMTTSLVESNPFFTESPLFLHYPQWHQMTSQSLLSLFGVLAELLLTKELHSVSDRTAQKHTLLTGLVLVVIPPLVSVL